MTCQICTIPEREPLLYEDDLVFLVKTLKMKGHAVRVMACIKRHSAEPTFEEHIRVITVLYSYMKRVLKRDPCYLCAPTHASIPEHFHYVACDAYSTDQEEMKLLADTEKVHFTAKNDILIGIPAHNEAEHIQQVVFEAKNYGDVLVLCDDCTDLTEQLAQDAGAKIIRQTPNVGYGGALNKIFEYARKHKYKKLITLDGDGQHNPEEIPQFLVALNSADLVIGNRFLGTHNTPYYRQMVIKTINGLLGVGDSQCGFRGFNKNAIYKMNLTETDMGASLEMLYLAKDLNVAEVPCNIVYEEEQKHSASPIEHGHMLAKTLFWSQIWDKPLLYLGLPSLLLTFLGVYWIAKMFLIYRTLNTFATGLALAGTGTILLGVLISFAAMQILISKRQIKEINR